MEPCHRESGAWLLETVLQMGLQQGDTENVFAQIAGGVPPPPRKAKYVKKDERLQSYLDRWTSPPQTDIDHNRICWTSLLIILLSASVASIKLTVYIRTACTHRRCWIVVCTDYSGEVCRQVRDRTLCLCKCKCKDVTIILWFSSYEAFALFNHEQRTSDVKRKRKWRLVLTCRRASCLIRCYVSLEQSLRRWKWVVLKVLLWISLVLSIFALQRGLCWSQYQI